MAQVVPCTYKVGAVIFKRKPKPVYHNIMQEVRMIDLRLPPHVPYDSTRVHLHMGSKTRRYHYRLNKWKLDEIERGLWLSADPLPMASERSTWDPRAQRRRGR